DLFHLPRERFDGTFTSGTSVANLIALTTAREWCGDRLGVDVTDDGVRALPDVRVYSVAPHISVVKALGIIGLGRKSFHPVGALPGREAMAPEARDQALEQARGAAAAPAIVVASAGTVSTGDFDDLTAIAEVCARRGAWLHVDGAFGLFARCCER